MPEKAGSQVDARSQRVGDAMLGEGGNGRPQRESLSTASHDRIAGNANWRPITISAYATLEARLGATVAVQDGVNWRRVRMGFWRPVFPFTRFAPGQRAAPGSARFVGFQHGVEQAAEANSFLDYLAFDHPQRYTETDLAKNKRRNLRKGLELFQLRRLQNFDEFTREAWPVYVSFYQRTHYGYRRDRLLPERFAAWARELFACPGVSVLGAYGSEGLAGVDICIWGHDIVIAGPTFSCTQALAHRISDVLLHGLRSTVAGLPAVRLLYMGTAAERDSLDQFKLERGAVRCRLPAYCRLNPLFRMLLPYVAPRSWNRLNLSPLDRSGDFIQDRGGDQPTG